MKMILAPNPIPDNGSKRIFLAGSIEMGSSEKWQDTFAKLFENDETNIQLLNPRRLDWDSKWYDGSEIFNEQVNWEKDALELADVIAMYFDPSTKSPISLLELGLFARSGKMIVCCPDGFWRKGNVDIICKRHNIYMAENMDELAVMVYLKLFNNLVDYKDWSKHYYERQK